MSFQELENSNSKHQISLFQSFQNDFLQKGHRGDNEIIKSDQFLGSNVYINSPKQNMEENVLIELSKSQSQQEQNQFNEIQNNQEPQNDSNHNHLRLQSPSFQKQKQGKKALTVLHKSSNFNENDIISINNISSYDYSSARNSPTSYRENQRVFSYRNYSKQSKYFIQEQNFNQSDKDYPKYGTKGMQGFFEPDSLVSINNQSISSPVYLNQLNKSQGSPFYNSFGKNDRILQFQQNKAQTAFVKEEMQQSQVKRDKAIKIIQQIKNNQTNRVNRVNILIKQFLKLLIIYSGKNYVKYLQKYQLDYVNDQGSYFQFKEKNQLLSRIKQSIRQLFSSCPSFNIPLFMPTQMFHIIWDICLVLYTVPMLIFLSIVTFCAQHQQDSFHFEYFLEVSFVVFLFDMIFNFNTAHFNKDLIVQDRKLIAKRYIQTHFFPDITVIVVIFFKFSSSAYPLFYNPDNDIFQYSVNILIFFKIFCLPSKMSKFEDLIYSKENQKHKLKLLKLITSIILIAHTIGIGWHIMVIIENSNGIEQTWITKLNIQNENWKTKYIYSFYWCITTMTTVGFGDITPANEYEGFFMSITMIFMSCIFAYTISNVGMILQEIEKKHRELTHNISNIYRYLNRKNVNMSLKSRVKNYLIFLSEEQKDRNKEAEDQVFNKLSNKLREEITIEVNSKIVNTNSILTKNFTVQTLNKIVFAMKEILVSPNEIIFKEEQVDDQAIYFIQSGQVEIFHSYENNKNKQINQIFTKRLGPSAVFGELSFFSGLSRKASAKSVNLTTLYKLTRDDFLKILEQNKEDFERYKMIQEQIIFQQDFSAINVECYCCNSIGHIAIKCPLIHNQRNKQFISLKSNFSIIQNRMKNPQTQNRMRFHARLLIEINKNIYSKLKQEAQYMSSSFRLMFTKNDMDSMSSNSSNDQSQSQSEELSNMDQSGMQKSQNTNTLQHPQNIRVLIPHNKTEEAIKRNSLNIPYQEAMSSMGFVEDGNDIRISRDDLYNFFNLRIKSPSTSSYHVSKQTSLNEKAKQNEKSFVKLESQIAEVDEDQFNQSMQEQEKQSQNAIRKNNFSDKKLQQKMKKGSRDSIQQNFHAVDSELVMNSLQSQENAIMLPQTLHIRQKQGSGQVQEQYYQKANAEESKETVRKKGKRFATQPPINPQLNQGILFQGYNDKNQFQIDKKQNDIHKSRKSCFMTQKDSQQVMQNFQKQQSGLNERINSDYKIKHSVVSKRKQSTVKRKTQINQQLNEYNLNLKMDNESFLVNQFNNNTDNLTMMEINKLYLLNQLNKRSQFTHLDLMDQQDSSFLNKYLSENFEEMKIFKRFFPLNNYDKVIQNIKQIQQNLKKQKKQQKQNNTARHKKSYAKNKDTLRSYSINNIRKNQIESEINPQMQMGGDFNTKPTYLSYGISSNKKFALYPINNLKIIN